MSLHLAIKQLYPNAGIISGDTLDDVVAYTNNGQQIELDKQSVQTKTDELFVEWQSKEYQRKRTLEYPSIGDQLDALFHAGVFPSDMADKIQAVKDKYPKV